MERYLITPTLYDNWRYYLDMESKTKQDFLDVLEKKPFEPSPQMLAGRKFEDDVFRLTCLQRKEMITLLSEIEGDAKYKACVHEVAAIVHGGLWQQRVMFQLAFDGQVFLVYGKADVLLRNYIYDIKYSQTYELGKYEPSVQHGIYMLGAGFRRFAYLISDGETVAREDYVMTEDLRELTISRIGHMVGSIMSDEQFKTAYRKHWLAKGEAEGPILNAHGFGK